MANQSKSYRKFVATAATASLVATALVPVASAAPANTSATFTDVAPQYLDAVNYLVNNDITIGKTPTQFGTSESIIRADAATWIAKAVLTPTQLSNVKDSGFTDVPDRAKNYVDALKENNILNGISATKFGSSNEIKRGDVARILAKAYDIRGNENNVTFTDVAPQYKSAVAALFDNGITNGKKDNRFGTDDSITRGELAIWIQRLETLSLDPADITVQSATAISADKVRVTFTDGNTEEFTLTTDLVDGVETEIEVSYLGEAHKVKVTWNEEDVDVIVGDLTVQSVEWASAQALAAGQSLFEAGTITVKAGSEGAILNGLKVNRGGLSSDDDIDSISIWDGNKRLNVPNIFANNQADITFSSPVRLAANEEITLSIRVNVDKLDGKGGDARVGSQLLFTLPSDGLKTNAAVSGTVASASNTYTIADVDLAEMTAETSPSAPTQTLKPGRDDQRLAEWEIEVKEEPVRLQVLTLTQDGSASDSDIRNLKLYQNGKQVGNTVETLDNRVATFEFDNGLLIENGEKIRLQLKGDVVGGSTRTVEFKIDNEVDVIGTDQTYGTTVTLSSDNDQVAGTRAPLEIDQGELLVSRSTSSPVAAKIDAKAKDHVFTTVAVESVGEAAQLRKVKIQARVTGNENLAVSNIENVKLVSDGKTLGQVSKPFSNPVLNANGYYEYELTLSNPITLKTGEKIDIDITADLENATEAAAGANITIGAAVSEAIGTLSGRKANAGINTFVNGRPMEVGAVALTISDAPVKSDREEDGIKYKNIFQSQSGVTLTTYNVQHDFSQTVELYDVRLNVKGGSSLTNIRLEDKDGNVVSDTLTTIGSTGVLTLNSPVDVAPGEVLPVKVVADIAANATEDVEISVSTDTVARYKQSGERVSTINYSDANQLVYEVVQDDDRVELGVDVSLVADLDPKITVQRNTKDATAAAFNIKSARTNAQDALIDKVFLSAELNGSEAKDYTNIRIVDKDGKVYGTAPSFIGNEAEITLNENFTVKRDSTVDLYVLVDIAGNAERGGELTVNLAGYEYIQAATGQRDVAEIPAEQLQDKLTTLITTSSQVIPEAVNTYPTNVDSLGGVVLAKFALPNTGNDGIDVTHLELIDRTGALKDSTALLGIYDQGGTPRGTLDLANVTEYNNENGNGYIVELDSTRRINAGATNGFEVRILETGDLVGKSVQINLGQFGTQYTRVNGNQSQYFPIDDDVTAQSVVLQFADNATYAPRTATVDPGEANKAAAKAVTDLIAALPAVAELELTDAEEVEAAREAYDALTAEQKELVTADDVAALEAAEEKIAELVPVAEITITTATSKGSTLSPLFLDFDYEIAGTVADAEVGEVVLTFTGESTTTSETVTVTDNKFELIIPGTDTFGDYNKVEVSYGTAPNVVKISKDIERSAR